MEMDEYHCLELETNKEGMERVEQVTVQLLSNVCRMAVIVMSNKVSNKIHISIFFSLITCISRFITIKNIIF